MDSTNNQRDISIMTPEDTSELFRLSLIRRMDVEGISQADIAKARIDNEPIVSKTHISRVLGNSSDYAIGTKLQRKIATFLGESVRGMINEGYQIKYGTQPQSDYDHRDSSEEHDLSKERRTPPSNTELTQLINERFRQLTDRADDAEKEILKWTSLLESLHESYSIVGKDGTFLYQNRKSVKLFGQHVGKHIDEAYKGLDPGDNTKLKEVLVTGLEYRKQEWQQGLFLDITYLPLLDAGGNVNRVALIGRDITDREGRKVELEDHLARFTGIFGSAVMGLCLIDEHGNVLITNEAFRSLSGRDETPENIGDMIESAMSMKNATDVAPRLMTSFKERTSSEGICIRPDGVKVWQDLRPLFNGEKFIGLICRLFDYDEERGERRFFKRENKQE